jgi:membrane protease YdiL (CAAX protease family)
MSIPMWVIGAVANDAWRRLIPINLPLSALMSALPLVAAGIVTHQEQEPGAVKALLRRAVDYRRIGDKRWYLPIFLLMPAIMFLSFWAMRGTGRPLPDSIRLPLARAPLFFAVFFLFAVGEEVGWSGFATDSMVEGWGGLWAAIILGVIWAVWHLVPYLQTQHSAGWIFWQCLDSVALRILIVWIYLNTGGSVLAAELFHSMVNVGDFLFPNYGSHFDPFVTGVITWAVAIVVAFVWGPRTLTRFRFATARQA